MNLLALQKCQEFNTFESSKYCNHYQVPWLDDMNNSPNK